MSEFDKQDIEVIRMVNNNPRRQGVIQDIGYIVSREEAEQLVSTSARKKGGDWLGVAMFALSVLVITATTILMFVRA